MSDEGESQGSEGKVSQEVLSSLMIGEDQEELLPARPHTGLTKKPRIIHTIGKCPAISLSFPIHYLYIFILPFLISLSFFVHMSFHFIVFFPCITSLSFYLSFQSL